MTSTPQDRPVPPDSLTLRPRRIGTFATVGILAAVTVAFLAVALILNPFVWILFVASACALGVVGFAALPGRSYLKLGREGFEIRTPFRQRRFAWRDVTNFVAVPSAGEDSVVFRSRFSPGAALPPAPAPTDEDRADASDAVPSVHKYAAKDLARLMNEWRERAISA